MISRSARGDTATLKDYYKLVIAEDNGWKVWREAMSNDKIINIKINFNKIRKQLIFLLDIIFKEIAGI